MKVAVILFVSIGIAHARPQVFSKSLEAAKAFITSFTNENKGPGEYSYKYETSDGIRRNEYRIPIKVKNETRFIVRGSYAYTGPDGNEYVVGYTADERGFRPTGEHIPLSAGVVVLKPQDIPKAAIITLQGGIG